MHKALKKMVREYELKKAGCADDNDKKIDEDLQVKFETSKDTLRKSVHHIKLQANLEASFGVLDELEEEYRAFHKRNEEIAASHEDIIENTFWEFELKFAGIFELFASYDESRKELLEKDLLLEKEKKTRWLLKC